MGENSSRCVEVASEELFANRFEHFFGTGGNSALRIFDSKCTITLSRFLETSR